MTLRSVLPTLVLSLALVACAKASDEPLGEDGTGGSSGSTGGQAGTSAGKGGAGGKSGSGGEAGSTSGSSGQGGGDGGTDGGSGGEDPGGSGGTDGGSAGDGGSGGSSGSSGQGGTGTPGCDPVIVINEVSTDGTNGSDEFVELYNASGCKVDLAGWALAYYPGSASKLEADRNDLWVAPSSQPLAAGGYLVLASSGFSGSQDGALSSGLSKSGAGLALFNTSDTAVDRMAWGNVDSGHPCIEGAKVSAIDSNKSAARSPDGADTDDNAADFANNVARTPGQAN